MSELDLAEFLSLYQVIAQGVLDYLFARGTEEPACVLTVDLLEFHLSGTSPERPHLHNLLKDPPDLCGMFDPGLISNLADQHGAFTRIEVRGSKHAEQDKDVLPMPEESLDQFKVPQEVQKLAEILCSFPSGLLWIRRHRESLADPTINILSSKWARRDIS
jgi:hypothetical protein